MSDHGSFSDVSVITHGGIRKGSDQGAERSTESGAAVGGKDHRLVVANSMSASRCANNDPTELVCAACQPLEDRVAALEAERLELIAENTRQGSEIAGLQDTLRALGASKQRLKNELAQVREEDPASETIKQILTVFVRATGRDRRTRVDMAGDRAALVRKQLRRYKAEELIEAIKGMALLPYVRNGKRVQTGSKGERYNDIEHAIGTDKRIADRRDDWLRASDAALAESHRIFDGWGVAAAQESLYAQLVLGAICRREWQEMTVEQRDEFRAQFADVVEIRRAGREGPDEWEQAA